MTDEHNSFDPDFTLGTPSIVCRWRLSGASLPMANRHLRALGKRVGPSGKPVSCDLIAWAKQHIEWTLKEGASRHPEGTLMVVIDEEGRAAMSVGPYEPLEDLRFASLLGRIDLSYREGEKTGVPPETIWAVVEGVLCWGLDEQESPSGAATLVEDLAKTLGIRVERRPGLLNLVRSRQVIPSEVFFVSDEHGIVLPDELSGEMGEKFASGYRRLLERSK